MQICHQTRFYMYIQYVTKCTRIIRKFKLWYITINVYAPEMKYLTLVLERSFVIVSVRGCNGFDKEVWHSERHVPFWVVSVGVNIAVGLARGLATSEQTDAAELSTLLTLDRSDVATSSGTRVTSHEDTAVTLLLLFALPPGKTMPLGGGCRER